MQDVLILDFAVQRFVALAAEIAAVSDIGGQSEADGTGAGATEAVACPAVDLTELLGQRSKDPDAASQCRHLRVRAADRDVLLRCNASLILDKVDREAFFRLPRLLRHCGCAAWVRGAVLLRASDGHDYEADDNTPDHNTDVNDEGGDEDEATLAVWIDLHRLAESAVRAQA